MSRDPSPTVEYMFIDGTEDPNEYRKGGYYPVSIGDHIHQKYRIVHKLGHGSFSTVWLAIEEQQSRYVAIKVGTADTDQNEVDVLSHLTQVSTAKSREFFPVVFDRFDLHGPNGTHPCIVTQPARCSLRDAKDFYLLPLDVARSLAAQLTVSVAFIHSHGYAHADIHLGNILLQLPSSLADLPLNELYARFGKPIETPVLSTEKKEAPREPGVPSHLIDPVWLGIHGPEIQQHEARLILSDFGVSFRPDEKSRFKSYTPLAYRPPEALFEPTTPLTLASDLWSLGCIIFELFAHRSLIETAWLNDQDDVTSQQVELQGMLPPEWWKAWKKREKWYDELGNPLSEPDAVWSWQRRFEDWVQSPRKKDKNEKVGALDEEEYAALLDLLQRILAWRPENRLTAKEILEDKWMKRWALPAWERTLAGGT